METNETSSISYLDRLMTSSIYDLKLGDEIRTALCHYLPRTAGYGTWAVYGVDDKGLTQGG